MKATDTIAVLAVWLGMGMGSYYFHLPWYFQAMGFGMAALLSFWTVQTNQGHGEVEA